jgi:hypothetical protein
VAKQTRRTSARSARTNKNRPAKLKAAANRRELESIEDLLGEDFDSITEARKALKRETGPAPGKDFYSVRELSTRKNKTVQAFLSDIHEHRANIDALKKPKEFWAAEIYGHGTYQLFSTTADLVKKLSTYKGLQTEDPTEALKNIKVIHVKGVNALAQYQESKRLDLEEQWRLRKLKGIENRKRKRQQESKIKRLEREVKELRASNRALKRKR